MMVSFERFEFQRTPDAAIGTSLIMAPGASTVCPYGVVETVEVVVEQTVETKPGAKQMVRDHKTNRIRPVTADYGLASAVF
jgi:hypothetical protein